MQSPLLIILSVSVFLPTLAAADDVPHTVYLGEWLPPSEIEFFQGILTHRAVKKKEDSRDYLNYNPDFKPTIGPYVSTSASFEVAAARVQYAGEFRLDKFVYEIKTAKIEEQLFDMRNLYAKAQVSAPPNQERLKEYAATGTIPIKSVVGYRRVLPNGYIGHHYELADAANYNNYSRTNDLVRQNIFT